MKNEQANSEWPEGMVVRGTAVDRERFPDLDNAKSVVLKDGPRSRKEATYWVIVDRHSGEVHHDALSIKSFAKRQGQLVLKPENSVSLTSEGDDEIQRLIDFLQAVRSGSVPNKTSEFLVVEAPDDPHQAQGLQRILGAASATGTADVLAGILERTASDPDLFQALLVRAGREPQLFAEAVAALNLVTYRRAVDELEALITATDPVREARLQALLAENPWMFGSEYSELLTRRTLTRDEQQDFVLRRTTDGFIECVEIKTPLNGTDLFRFDPSHKSFYAGAELSKAVGQVQLYIEKLDARRDAILADDGEDTCKIRAKIIIGRDGNADQVRALRRFNGHLHRIEVLTFDQLLRIARNVLGYLEGVLKPVAEV